MVYRRQDLFGELVSNGQHVHAHVPWSDGIAVLGRSLWLPGAGRLGWHAGYSLSVELPAFAINHERQQEQDRGGRLYGSHG